MNQALFDVSMNPILLALLAAEGDNVLFDITNPTAEAEAASVLGVREIWVAPFDENGVARAGDFILLARLRAGDTGPTPEAVTEDTTYDNGTVVSNQTGVNNGSKTWEIEGSADDPAISMLIDHCRIPGFGTTQKRGKPFAYIAFAEDRSSLWGTAKVNTASPPREGAQRWAFNIPFETVGLRRPGQNPVSGVAINPSFTALAPVTGSNAGPVAVTVTGDNLMAVTGVVVGNTRIDDAQFISTSQEEIQFEVPAGLTTGPKDVVLEHDNGTVSAGTFTVTGA